MVVREVREVREVRGEDDEDVAYLCCIAEKNSPRWHLPKIAE